jgi:hypothetical protein
MHTRDLLVQCAALLNKYGPDHAEVVRFIEAHGKTNKEFAKLAELSRTLKREVLRQPPQLIPVPR